MRPAHQQLLEEYVEALRSAKGAAEEWWKALLTSETEKAENRDHALQSLKQRWPYGTAAHPRVLAVIRKYYFACEALNNRLAGT
jgi:hypothetical protein